MSKDTRDREGRQGLRVYNPYAKDDSVDIFGAIWGMLQLLALASLMTVYF